MNKPASRAKPIVLHYRHRLPVRIMHWINAICFFVLLMSGLGIFNAHPALYWGNSSYTNDPALLVIGNTDDAGVTQVFGHLFDTTGLLGLSKDKQGNIIRTAFPHWATIPGAYSLSDSRLWHFFFAWMFVINGTAYLLYSVFVRHLQRDLMPDRTELKMIGRSIKDHLLFRHAHGEAATRYNVLQKLAYLTAIFVLLPLVTLMGMAMSPMLDALNPGWVNWFGGRQAARSLHFVAAWLLVVFVLIHVFEVLISGWRNQLRAMLTGYYAIDEVSSQVEPHDNS